MRLLMTKKWKSSTVISASGATEAQGSHVLIETGDVLTRVSVQRDLAIVQRDLAIAKKVSASVKRASASAASVLHVAMMMESAAATAAVKSVRTRAGNFLQASLQVKENRLVTGNLMVKDRLKGIAEVLETRDVHAETASGLLVNMTDREVKVVCLEKERTSVIEKET